LDRGAIHDTEGALPGRSSGRFLARSNSRTNVTSVRVGSARRWRDQAGCDGSESWIAPRSNGLRAGASERVKREARGRRPRTRWIAERSTTMDTGRSKRGHHARCDATAAPTKRSRPFDLRAHGSNPKSASSHVRSGCYRRRHEAMEPVAAKWYGNLWVRPAPVRASHGTHCVRGGFGAKPVLRLNGPSSTIA